MPQSNKVALKVQSLSGFDKSHYHDLSANVGQLVPVLTDELIPNTTANLNVAASVQLPPLASDAFAKIDLKLEAFAVPHRLLYGGFEKWFADDTARMMDYDSGDSFEQKPATMPHVTVSSDWESLPSVFGKGSLSDYMGLKLSTFNFEEASINIMPLLAYHKIWDDWYRAPLVQNQAFSDGLVYDDNLYPTSNLGVANLPYLSINNPNFLYELSDDNNWMYFNDGSVLWTIRPRNYGFDYFTNAWPTLQFGSPMSIAPDAQGNMTIAAIRAANSMQQFKERNLFSKRYNEAVKSRYGATLSSAVVQRSVFLGSASIPIKTYGVDVSALNDDGDQNNPFALSAGAQLGRARGEGFVNLIDNYHTDEPCYILIIASVVPRAVYSSGTSRIFDRYVEAGGLTDMANPLLQNTGNQPIYSWEVTGGFGAANHRFAFGYTDRYADWMTLPDRVSGNLREGGNLSSFVLKRNFENYVTTTISSNFLQIPATALDEISATETAISQYGCWMQFGFDYKVVQPLALYSLPSLQDPAYEHGHTVEVHRGGFRL